MFKKTIIFNESDIERLNLALSNKNFYFPANRKIILHLNMLRFLQNSLFDYCSNNNLSKEEHFEFLKLSQYILFD